MKKQTQPRTRKPVVVTTAHRGVFVGYLEEETETTAVLSDARMVVYWSPATRSVLGLAAAGPDKNCRISASVKTLKLRGVTATWEATEEAAAKWEDEPWA